MAKGICPILSDPKVKAEFEELVDALGEVQAYAVWDQNGGYSLDKAPNGEPSILFETLLQHNNGNRVDAIQYIMEPNRNLNNFPLKKQPKQMLVFSLLQIYTMLISMVSL